MARPEPTISDRTRPFWTGGARGQLLIARCQACGRWLHPPLPVCPRCRGMDVQPEPVSGRGTVWSFTVNRYRWTPGLEPPYVIAEVELEEQPGLRVLTALVGYDGDGHRADGRRADGRRADGRRADGRELRIGLPVTVRFEQAGDAWVPVFAP